MPPVRKEQLYSEDTFIRYCSRDDFQGQKLGATLMPEFLRAAERDELIVPLLTQKETRQQNGKDEEVEIRYYSPFQIFLVAGLIHNKIDDEGYLRSPDHWEFYKKQGTRYIQWESGAFWAEHYKAKRGEKPDPMMWNHFSLADDFHNVLRLIHGLEPEKRYELMEDKRRLFTGAPVLAYNLDPVRSGKATYVEQYSVDAERLKRVIASVGSLASNIDPLERWFSYIRRHPQVRRDKLKGLAAVAQDLYAFCDIGYELMEIAYGEKLPPLLDLIHPGVKPYMMDRTEYASGEDIKAIRAAFSNLQTWVGENKDLIEELRPAVEKEKLESAILQVGEQITDYEKRYGDRRYVGSTRTIRGEPKLKLEDLDAETRKWVEGMFEQRIAIEEKKKKLSDKEREQILAHEMTFAIENRMGDLGRSIVDISSRITEATWRLESKIEHEKEMVKMPALQEFSAKVPRTDPDYARKQHEFWTKGLKEYEKPHQDRLDALDRARAELGSIGNQSRLVFCAACREKPVQLHYAYMDRQITNEAVCDECLEKEAKKVMVGTDEDRKNTKYAEWRCDNCDQLLLKFAVGNTIAVRTLNKVPIQIELEYGHMGMQAKCPACSYMNIRPLDWGWIS